MQYHPLVFWDAKAGEGIINSVNYYLFFLIGIRLIRWQEILAALRLSVGISFVDAN